MKRLLGLSIGIALLTPVQAFAGETITYTYDAKGRLTGVSHAGGREDGLSATYVFDPADNRIQTQVTGARRRVIVTPLGGALRVTPIR